MLNNEEEMKKYVCDNIQLVKEGKIKARSIPHITTTKLNAVCPVCGYDYSQPEVFDWQMEKIGNAVAYQTGTINWFKAKPYLVSCLWCSTWLICDDSSLTQTTLDGATDAGKWKISPILPYEPSGLKTPRKT